MSDFLASIYPWTKSLHVISVISWMAAMLYLPRLFVYHAERGGTDSAVSDTFKIMERRLLKAIMIPAMNATWFFGLTLVFTPGVVDIWSDTWFHVKFACVVLMTIIHGWLAQQCQRFADDENTMTPRTFRIVNEIPAVLMIIIVVMVIARPF